MNRKIIISIIAIILIAAGATAAYLFLKPAEKSAAPSKTAESTVEQDKDNAKKQPAQPQLAAQPGSYTPYSAEAFANAKGKRLLFFHASWCPQCRKLEADIIKTKLPDGVTIFKVDYDTATSLRQKYAVTLQTTVVNVDQSGEPINKIVAYDDPSYATLQRAFNL